MKTKIKILALLLLPLTGMGQGHVDTGQQNYVILNNSDTDEIAAVPSIKMDTLYFLNSMLGAQIRKAWDYDSTLVKPVFILVDDPEKLKAIRNQNMKHKK